MNLPKLLAFLASPGLHCTRLKDLEDPFEGRYPKHALKTINSEYARMERKCGRDPGPNPHFGENTTIWVRESVYVNCWCCHNHESEALWRIYAHPDGVALTTTFRRLKEALPEDHYVGKVRYLDYAEDSPSPDNTFNLAITKRTNYAHEHEVRVVRSIAPVHLVFPELPDETPPFLTTPISFGVFDTIYTSPFVPAWQHRLVQDLLRRYGCPIKLERSRMVP